MDTNTLAKSDLFFVITTVVVIILAIGIGVGLMYLISILRSLRRISKKVEDTAQTISSNIKNADAIVKREGISGAILSDIVKSVKAKPKTKK